VPDFTWDPLARPYHNAATVAFAPDQAANQFAPKEPA
jgi:hypothetical protein